MVRLQLTVVALAVVLCGSSAEARGRRTVRQQGYTPYYQSAPAYNTAPAYNAAPNYNTVPAYNTAQATTFTAPTGTVVSTTPTVTESNIVQMSGTSPSGSVITADSSTVATGAYAGTSNASAPGSAQWKAEQSAQRCSVQHLGGSFGGGSFEGNGFGATPDQAIRNACFWGQKTPIQIGVARGANGYYATIFYR